MRISIIGGGIAGSYIAWLLSKEGFKISLFDPQKKYRKACGDSTPKDSLSGVLAEDFNVDLNYVQNFKILINGIEVRNVYFRKPIWIIIDKWKLVDNLRASALEYGTKYFRTALSPRTLKDKVDLVIDARGPFAAKDYILVYRVVVRASWPEDLALIDFRPKEGGLYWIFPHGDNTVNAGGGFMYVNTINLKRLVTNYIKKVLKDANVPIIDAKAAPIRITGSISIFQDHFIMKVGEAAGLVNSTSGEGIRHAVISAHALAEAISKCNIDFKCISKKYKHDVNHLIKEVSLSRKMLYVALNEVKDLSRLFQILPDSFWREYFSGNINSFSMFKNIINIKILSLLGLKGVIKMLPK
jgi:flavin-dependent dehydrogenase